MHSIHLPSPVPSSATEDRSLRKTNSINLDVPAPISPRSLTGQMCRLERGALQCSCQTMMPRLRVDSTIGLQRNMLDFPHNLRHRHLNLVPVRIVAFTRIHTHP